MPAQNPNFGSSEGDSSRVSPSFASSIQSKIPILNQKSKSFFLFVTSSCLIILIIVFFVIGIDQSKRIVETKPDKLPQLGHDVNKPENTVQRIENLEQIPPEIQEVYRESFNKEIKKAQNETDKFNAFYNVYSGLAARFNVTKDQEVLNELKELESFIHENWPDIHKSVKESGGFIE